MQLVIFILLIVLASLITSQILTSLPNLPSIYLNHNVINVEGETPNAFYIANGFDNGLLERIELISPPSISETSNLINIFGKGIRSLIYHSPGNIIATGNGKGVHMINFDTSLSTISYDTSDSCQIAARITKTNWFSFALYNISNIYVYDFSGTRIRENTSSKIPEKIRALLHRKNSFLQIFSDSDKSRFGAEDYTNGNIISEVLPTLDKTKLKSIYDGRWPSTVVYLQENGKIVEGNDLTHENLYSWSIWPSGSVSMYELVKESDFALLTSHPYKELKLWDLEADVELFSEIYTYSIFTCVYNPNNHMIALKNYEKFYYIYEIRTENCDAANCSICKFKSDFCVKCSSGLLIENGICVTNCSNNRVPFENKYCKRCAHMMKILGVTCVLDCDLYNHYDNGAGVCKSCPDNCLKCKDENTCTSCKQNSINKFLLKGECVASCPFNYKEAIGTCEEDCPQGKKLNPISDICEDIPEPEPITEPKEEPEQKKDEKKDEKKNDEKPVYKATEATASISADANDYIATPVSFIGPVLQIFSLDLTGQSTIQFGQFQKLIIRLGYINLNYGSKLEKFISTNVLNSANTDPGSNWIQNTSPGSRLSKLKLRFNFFSIWTFNVQILFFMLSFIIQIFIEIQLRRYQAKKKIKKKRAMLIYYSRRIHNLAFQSIVIDGVFFCSHTLLNLKYSWGNAPILLGNFFIFMALNYGLVQVLPISSISKLSATKILEKKKIESSDVELPYDQLKTISYLYFCAEVKYDPLRIEKLNLVELNKINLIDFLILARIYFYHIFVVCLQSCPVFCVVLILIFEVFFTLVYFIKFPKAGLLYTIMRLSQRILQFCFFVVYLPCCLFINSYPETIWLQTVALVSIYVLTALEYSMLLVELIAVLIISIKESCNKKKKKKWKPKSYLVYKINNFKNSEQGLVSTNSKADLDVTKDKENEKKNELEQESKTKTKNKKKMKKPIRRFGISPMGRDSILRRNFKKKQNKKKNPLGAVNIKELSDDFKKKD